MRWFGNLLLGIFTRHLGTKVLALLLSLGLFGFVQASLTGVREVAQLELRFTLAEDLRSKYILVTEKMTFSGLTMTGLQSKIDPLAKTSALPLLIDQRVLNVYGRPHEDGTAIPIDTKLFQDERLLGKEITVGGLPRDLALIVNTLGDHTVPVEVVPALTKVTSAYYEGPLSFTLNVKQVTLRGPKSAFEAKDPKIVVNVQNIGDRISAQPVPDSGILKLSGFCDILWKDGGIRPDLVSLLRVTAEGFGTEQLLPRDFQSRLAISCHVVKKKEATKLEKIPIQIRNPIPQTFDFPNAYTALSGFTDFDLSNGLMPQLNVRLPAALAGNKEFKSNLVVVLDVTEATEDLGRLKVPFFLALKDMSRPDAIENLSQVEIVDPAVGEFNRKP